MYPQIVRQYVDTGKLRYVLMDMPLAMHKLAAKAAEATHCAEEQGKFWEMHDRLFENAKALEPWSAHAQALGLDVPMFDQCMNSGRMAAKVQADAAEAQKAGATGTPSFVIARTDPNDPRKVTGLAFMKGAQQFPAFQAEIDKALAQ